MFKKCILLFLLLNSILFAEDWFSPGKIYNELLDNSIQLRFLENNTFILYTGLTHNEYQYTIIDNQLYFTTNNQIDLKITYKEGEIVYNGENGELFLFNVNYNNAIWRRYHQTRKQSNNINNDFLATICLGTYNYRDAPELQCTCLFYYEHEKFFFVVEDFNCQDIREKSAPRLRDFNIKITTQAGDEYAYDGIKFTNTDFIFVLASSDDRQQLIDLITSSNLQIIISEKNTKGSYKFILMTDGSFKELLDNEFNLSDSKCSIFNR